MTVIDIHPHIVSPEVNRYPLAPLGGRSLAHSSTVHFFGTIKLYPYPNQSGAAQFSICVRSSMSATNSSFWLLAGYSGA